jgi:DNA-binding transcriptional MocR family regulator
LPGRHAAQPAKAVFLTPSHQFPTGTTLALDRRLAVIEWARQHQAWIIEDDYDSEFHYAGKPTACVQGSMRTTGRSTSAPSPNRYFPACASATWCCRRSSWRP